jgi:hypothetical protein
MQNVRDVVCTPRYVLQGAIVIAVGILVLLGYFHYIPYYHAVNTLYKFTTTPNAMNDTMLYHDFNKTIYDIADTSPGTPIWTFILLVVTFAMTMFRLCFS